MDTFGQPINQFSVYSEHEVAKIFGFLTVQTFTKNKQLKGKIGAKKIGGSWYYLGENLINYLRKGKHSI